MVFDKTVAFQKERQANPEKYKGWSWCVADLNQIVGRIQAGWDIRFAGEEKVGKTSFMISQAMYSLKEGAKVFYLGNEESDEQIMLRMITNVSGVERNKFRDLALTDGDWKKVEEAGSAFHRFDGRVEYGITTLSEVKKIIARVPDLDILFIDGQGQLEAEGRWDSMAQAQGEVSRNIKLLTLPAKNGKMTPGGVKMQEGKALTVVTAVHLNDDGKSLWTRGVGRDADVYLKMHQVSDPAGNNVPNKRLIEVYRSRHSGAGDSVKIYINGARSLVGSLVPEQVVDINKVADYLLRQPRQDG